MTILGKLRGPQFILYYNIVRDMAIQKDSRLYLSAPWIVFLIQNLHHIEFFIKHLHQKFITVSKQTKLSFMLILVALILLLLLN